MLSAAVQRCNLNPNAMLQCRLHLKPKAGTVYTSKLSFFAAPGQNLGPDRPPTKNTTKGHHMAEKFVAKATEFKDGDRRIVFVGEHEIGVFRDKGEFYAYSNFCLHQGGPACEGLTIAKVEERLRPDMTSQGLYFSETEMHFVCPWHGMEYDMKTGECVSDRKMKLRKYQVLQKGDEIYVVA
jgi:nitrite reductase/ring-hydroxylating ferredoxin subunit